MVGGFWNNVGLLGIFSKHGGLHEVMSTMPHKKTVAAHLLRFVPLALFMSFALAERALGQETPDGEIKAAATQPTTSRQCRKAT